MEHRTEEGNPLFKLRSSITTHHKHWYMSYNKSNNPLSSVYMTQMAVIKNVKGKRCKVQSACV